MPRYTAVTLCSWRLQKCIILLDTPFTNFLDHVKSYSEKSMSYETKITGKITVYYILISIFLERSREDKRVLTWMSATIPQIKLTLINFSINIVFITYSALNKYFICPLRWSLVNNKRCKTFQSSRINQAVLTMLSTNLSNMNTMLTQKFNHFFFCCIYTANICEVKEEKKVRLQRTMLYHWCCDWRRWHPIDSTSHHLAGSPQIVTT